MFLESLFGADTAESLLHGYRVGADHCFRGDGEEIHVIVLLDEICARHNLPGLVEGDFRDIVRAVVDVGGGVFFGGDERLR